MLTLEATYTVTLADFQAAQALWIRSRTSRRIAFLVFQRVMPIFGLMALLAVLYDMLVRHFQFQPSTAGLLFALVWLGLFCPLYRLFQIRKLYRQMKNGRPDDALTELLLLDDQLVSRLPGISEGRFSRAAVLAFHEDGKMALVVVGAKRFLPIPKRALTEEQWNMLRIWLAEPGSR